MSNIFDHNLVCKWCGERAVWSSFFDSYMCADCRTDDVEEKEDL